MGTPPPGGPNFTKNFVKNGPGAQFLQKNYFQKNKLKLIKNFLLFFPSNIINKIIITKILNSIKKIEKSNFIPI